MAQMQIRGSTQIIAGSIPNTALTNSAVVVGSTNISLGGTSTTLAGLTSVTSTTFVGALTGNATSATSATTATTATNIAGGAAGSIAYQSGPGTTTMLAVGSNTQVLTLTGGVPVWATPASGGMTNPMTTVGDSIYGAAAGAATRLAIGTTGQVYTVVSGIPGWSSTPTLTGTNFTGIPNAALTNNTVTVGTTSIALGASATTIGGLVSVTSTGFTGALTGNASSATNLSAGTVNSIPYQTGAGATTYLAQGTGVLQETAGAPIWTTTPTLTGTNFTGIPNTALTNNTVTVGTTGIALGTSATTLVGLSSVTSTTFVGSLTGHASLDLPIGGGTLTGALILQADPVTGLGAATKNYVDNSIAGLVWKGECAVATTANITLSGEQTIDGILTSSSVVLVKNQTTASQNGRYISGTGAWVRTADSTTGAQILGEVMYIIPGGTTNGGTSFVNTNASAITVGTTSITYGLFNSGATYTNGTGISLTGNVFANTGALSLQGTANQVLVNATSGSPVTGAITLTLPQSINSGAAPTFTGTNFTGIPNTGLTNSSVTIGSTSVALGATVTTFAGLTSVTATTFVGALTGNATTCTTVPALTGDVTTTGSTNATTINTTAGSGFIKYPNFIAGEVVSGTINGSNTAFTLVNTPQWLQLTLNGQILQSGAGNDFTISGTAITMLYAPLTGDKLLAWYLK